MELNKGHVYSDGNGRFRKTLKFTNANGEDVQTAEFVHWVRCHADGSVVGAGRENRWTAERFLVWAATHIERGDTTQAKGASPNREIPVLIRTQAIRDKTIILAVKLYDHYAQTRMAFYCFIPGVKEGYMVLNVGPGRADYAFWSGLHKVVSLLHRTYRSYGLHLAVYKAALSLEGKIDKEKVRGLFDGFVHFTDVPCDPFVANLDVVNDLSISDRIAPGELKGYSLEVISTAQPSPLVASNVKSRRYEYYSDILMPRDGVVLDFEATSPIAKYARMIEISALRFRDGQIIDRFETLVNPKIKIPKVVRELTGITDQDVADKPNTFQALKQLNNFIARSPVLVGHNIQYDYSVLKAICDKAKVRLWKGPLLCTMKEARRLKLPIESHDLTTLCEVFGIVNERPHRAWGDTKATFELMKSIYQSHLV